MNHIQRIKRDRTFANPCRVTKGKRFRLRRIDPGRIGEPDDEDKPDAGEDPQHGIEAHLKKLALIKAALPKGRWGRSSSNLP